MKAEEILGDEEFRNLQEEVMEELAHDTNYSVIEQIFSDYGLEMDYLFDVIK